MNIKTVEFKDMIIKYDSDKINEKIIKKSNIKFGILFSIFSIFYIILAFIVSNKIKNFDISLSVLFFSFTILILLLILNNSCEYYNSKRHPYIRFMNMIYKTNDIKVVLYDDDVIIFAENFCALSEYELKRFFESYGVNAKIENNFDKTKKIYLDIDITEDTPICKIKNKE